MSDERQDRTDDDPEAQGVELADAPSEEGDAEQPQRMELDVRIEPRSACQRHVTVTIPRADVDRYLDRLARGELDL